VPPPRTVDNTPEIHEQVRKPLIPENRDSRNDFMHVQIPVSEQLLDLDEYPQPDIRGPMPRNAHPDSTFSSHLHNDWTHV